MHTFNEAYPGARTEVVCGNSERLLEALANGTIELALLGDAPDEPQLERHFIMRDELVLITSPGHRLAGLSQVHVRDLAGEFLIVQGTKSMLRERIVQALHESDTPFNVSVENIAIEAIKRLVVQGLGIGFVPLMCVHEELEHDKLAILRVEGVRNEWNLSLVWRKNHSLSPASRSFVDICLATGSPPKSDPSATLEDRAQGSSVKKGQPFTIHPRKAIHC